MRLPHFKKKFIAGAVAAGLVMGAAGLAAAYFGVTGSGNGTANTGHANNVKIESVGAGYTSIIPVASGQDPYVEDQCFACAGITELGDQVHLTGSGFQQLTSISIAFRNWGGTAISTLPVTVSFTNGPAGPFSVTRNVDLPAALVANTTPSLTVATLTIAATGLFVTSQFVYGISYLATGTASGLNIALSNETNDVAVGSDTTLGYIWVKSSEHNPGTEFPACVTIPTATLNTFVKVHDACGAAREYLAYGTTNPTTHGNIPAVSFNVVGGAAGPLYPGAPASPVEYAVTNPGPSAAHLTTVSTAFGTLPTGCAGTWFAIYGTQPHTVDRTFPPGLTVVTNTGTTIAMLTKPVTQDSCKNMAIPLTFTGSHA